MKSKRSLQSTTKVQDVLLQVNVAREASKTGMTVEEFPEIRDYAKTLPHVRVTGLDVYGAIFDDPEEASSNLSA